MTWTRRSLTLAAVSLLLPVAALAQYPSPVVGFNGPPIDDPATCQEMFQRPQHSGTTSQYIINSDPNDPNTTWINAAYRQSGFQPEGAAAERFYFFWDEPADPNAWVRMTTANGPIYPNPALHTEGKVRFKVVNISELFLGEIGVCIGIRETGVNVPQLWNGGGSGDIEWVGVSTTYNGITAGADMIVNTTAAGDDIQVYPLGTDIGPNGLNLPTGTAVIAVGPNGVLNTNPAGDDQRRFGYFIDGSGARRPVPAVTLMPSPLPYQVEFNLVTGAVTVDGVPAGGGIAGFTGNGDLSAANDRGTLEHIAVTSVADGASNIDLYIDELQFEAPVPDPVLPPVVRSPILSGATTVTVTGLMPTVDAVKLYRNGGLLQTINTNDPNDVVFTIAPAVPADVYTATQVVDGIESPPSAPVTVTYTDQFPVIYLVPPEGATSVLVGNVNPAAQQVIVTKNGMTQFTAPGNGTNKVSVPVSGLVAGDVLTAVDWFNGAPSATSPPDTVTIAGLTSVLSDNFESYADQAAMEAVWTQASGVDVLLSTDENATCPDGLKSALVPGAGATPYMTRVLNATPTATEPVIWNVNFFDPVGVDPGNQVNQWAELNYLGGTGPYFFIHVGAPSGTFVPNRTYYAFRAVGTGGPNWVVMNQYDAPQRSLGWHNFTVVHKGSKIDVYADGLLCLKNVSHNATPPIIYARADIGGGFASVAGAYFDDFVVEKGAAHFGCISASQPPTQPSITAPIVAGDMTVDVENVGDTTDTLQILAAGDVVIGTATGPFGSEATVTLTRPLVHLESIRARAINDFGNTDSAPLEVGIGNGDVLVCIGVRETNDTGPLGSPGGTSGEIEWVGAASAINGAPQGTPIGPSDNWYVLTFNPLTGPITGFTGNGAITATRGVLEHLAISVNSTSAGRSTGPYEVYVDNVVNVGAGPGGSDFVLTDFEGYALGTEVMFQEPTYSGTTSGDMAPAPSSNGVSDLEGNPGQSYQLIWFWRDTTSERWARITTFGVANLPNPIIDLTKPIRLHLLLAPPGPAVCIGDTNCDGVVGFGDINPFVTGLTGGPMCNPDNFDINQNGTVGFDDINPFVSLLSGGGGPCP